jgi:hypothetical protein
MDHGDHASVELGIAEHDTASLCGLQCILCPLRDHLAFVLGDGAASQRAPNGCPNGPSL